jgi:hypothetical protein
MALRARSGQLSFVGIAAAFVPQWPSISEYVCFAAELFHAAGGGGGVRRRDAGGGGAHWQLAAPLRLLSIDCQ